MGFLRVDLIEEYAVVFSAGFIALNKTGDPLIVCAYGNGLLIG